MNFEVFLKSEALEVEKQIEAMLEDFANQAKSAGATLLPLMKAFKKANKGGKKIRGVLIKLGYELAKQSQYKEVYKVAAAYEIFHTAILAHDDIIDESPKRRGQKSLYKSVGTAQAITLGDYGFFLAIKIISESKFDMEKKNPALNFFLKTMIGTAVGQMLDIARGDRETTAKLKTARYTIAGPLQLGAILAGADQDLVKKLGDFGESLGIAFQIRDDILDKEVELVELAEKQVIEYTSRAEKMIPAITSDNKLRTLLEEMTEYLVQRTK